MRTQVEMFSLADRLFYEHPEHWRTDDADFTLASRELPAGWTRGRREGWVVLQAPGRVLPDQGWKIHVSSVPEQAADCLERAAAVLLAAGVSFKFLGSPALLRATNLKYAPRSSSGKFITVYPADEAEFARLLPRLDAALTGIVGPYVLSDLRFRSGPLYVRYGAFRSRFCRRPDGERVLALLAPDGTAVPDERGPGFATPDWVTVPPVLAESMAARSGGGELPYRVVRALHFSNGGGVYEAQPAAGDAAGTSVILKEARPHAGLAGDGTDAVTRLRTEAQALRSLADIAGIPRLLGEHRVWEHEFLAIELMPGRTLQAWVAQHLPLIGREPDRLDCERYAQRAGAVLDRVAAVVADVHAAGFVLGDLHPANILVDAADGVALVDFEATRPVERAIRQTNGHAGFVDPGATGYGIDHHALGVLALWVFHPMTELLGLDPGRRQALAAVARAHFPSAARHLTGPADAAPAVGRSTTGTLPVRTASMARAIAASISPDRPDRLFPGDFAQFEPGQAAAFAHGAAGVVWSLRAAGHPVPPRALDWLVAAAGHTQRPPGFLDGDAGLAHVLAECGRPDEADDRLRAATDGLDRLTDVGLHSGLAGVGWALLNTPLGRDAERVQLARQVGDRLIAMVDDGAPHGVDVPSGATGRAVDAGTNGGLLRGWSGVALYLLQLAAVTGESAPAAAAVRAVHRDLRLCVRAGNGSLQVDGGFRTWPYLEVGSAGIALVVDEVLRRRPDPDLEAALPQLTAALSSTFVVDAHLRRGRAGLMAVAARLAVTRPELRTGPVAAAHLRRLGWHRVAYQGHDAFAGDGSHRLSMDYLTGTAGVLAAVAATLDPSRTFLPFLPAVSAPARPDLGGRAATSQRRPSDPPLAPENPEGGSHVRSGAADPAHHHRRVADVGEHDLERLLT